MSAEYVAANWAFLATAYRALSAPLPDLTPAQCRSEVVLHMAGLPHADLLRLAVLAGELARGAA